VLVAHHRVLPVPRWRMSDLGQVIAPWECCRWLVACASAGVPRSAALVVRLPLPSPRVSLVQRYLSCAYRALLTLHPCPSTSGRWRMSQSLRVHMSRLWRGDYMRRRPQSTKTSYAQFRLVCKKRQNLARTPMAPSMLSHISCVFVSTTFISGHHRCAYVAGGGASGVGGCHRCRGLLCHGNACCRDFCLGGCCDIGQCQPPC
jgi:hypothetical protein